jgi:hypothetical protein
MVVERQGVLVLARGMLVRDSQFLCWAFSKSETLLRSILAFSPGPSLPFGSWRRES